MGAFATLAAVAVAGVTGCGGPAEMADRAIPLSDSKPPASVAPSPTTTTTTAPAVTTTSVFAFGFDQALIQEAWNGYEAAVEAVEVAAVGANPEHVELANRMTGEMLSHWRGQLAEWRAGGIYAHYAAASTRWERLYGVRLVSDTEIVLTVCSYDDGVLLSRTGEVVNDAKTLVRADEQMVVEDGIWKLASRRGDKVEASQCPDS